MASKTSKTSLIVFGAIGLVFVSLFLFKQVDFPVATNTNQSVSASLNFVPSSLKLAKDAKATVSIALDPNKLSVVAVTLVVSYDPAKIKITSFTNGTHFPNILSGSQINNGKASLSIAMPPDSKGQTQSGTIATFQIESLSNTSSTLVFGEDTMAVALNQKGTILKNIGKLTIN